MNLRFITIGVDLFAGVAGVFIVLYLINQPKIREAKKEIHTQILMNKAAKKRLMDLNAILAQIGTMSSQGSGLQTQVHKYKQGLKAKAAKLRDGLQRRGCGNIDSVKFRIENTNNSEIKMIVNNDTGRRYRCESYEKLDREGRIGHGSTSLGSAQSAGR